MVLIKSILLLVMDEPNPSNNDDAGAGGEGGPILDGGAGMVYMPFVVMEDLLDKLKLLNYEEVQKTTDLNLYPNPKFTYPHDAFLRL